MLSRLPSGVTLSFSLATRSAAQEHPTYRLKHSFDTPRFLCSNHHGNKRRPTSCSFAEFSGSQRARLLQCLSGIFRIRIATVRRRRGKRRLRKLRNRLRRLSPGITTGYSSALRRLSARSNYRRRRLHRFASGSSGCWTAGSASSCPTISPPDVWRASGISRRRVSCSTASTTSKIASCSPNSWCVPIERKGKPQRSAAGLLQRQTIPQFLRRGARCGRSRRRR